MLTQIDAHIRWMIRRDMPEIMNIEQNCFDEAWEEEDFLKLLRERSVIGMIAEHNEKVLGYMLYKLHKDKLEMLTLAIHPHHQRSTIGTQMINKLVSKLTSHRRTSITATLKESNLNAQLFYKAQNFKCVKILKNHYGNEDGYKFKYSLS